MARMHARRKGKSGSTRPMRKEHPDWSSLNPREIEARVLDLGKTGRSASQIGMTLRDQYAVPDVQVATGKRINKILTQHKMGSEIPDDLRNLVKTALKIQKHLDINRKDLKNKRNLQLTESKIRRLTKYYQAEGRLSKDWKYSIEQAKLMFE